mgnify:CR=1 FL=1
MKRLTASLAAATCAFAVPATAAPVSASAAPGQDPLVSVLTADGDQFDKDRHDFDIVTEAALAVVAAKPDSPVAVLADGSVRVTAFVPTDQAFRLLAKDLTGKTIRSEEKLFGALVDLAGVDTIEQVLLYHVVPGATLTSSKVLKAHKAKLTTAQGGKVQVRIGNNHEGTVVKLRDRDRDDRDARVIAVDVNKGNKQVAHVVDRVLRPLNL